MQNLLTYLRSNWLALLIIVVAILWWRIVDWFTPTSPNLGWNPTLINIDYWSIVTDTNSNWVGWVVLLGFFCIAILSGLLLFLYIFPFWKVLYRLGLLLGGLLLCTLSTCTGRSLGIEDARTIEHMMSLEYQGKTYHLAYSEFYEFFESGSAEYYIFECDAYGTICTKISEVGELTWEKNVNAQIFVSDDELMFEGRSVRTQILPAVK